MYVNGCQVGGPQTWVCRADKNTSCPNVLWMHSCGLSYNFQWQHLTYIKKVMYLKDLPVSLQKLSPAYFSPPQTHLRESITMDPLALSEALESWPPVFPVHPELQQQVLTWQPTKYRLSPLPFDATPAPGPVWSNLPSCWVTVRNHSPAICLFLPKPPPHLPFLPAPHQSLFHGDLLKMSISSYHCLVQNPPSFHQACLLWPAPPTASPARLAPFCSSHVDFAVLQTNTFSPEGPCTCHCSTLSQFLLGLHSKASTRHLFKNSCQDSPALTWPVLLSPLAVPLYSPSFLPDVILSMYLFEPSLLSPSGRPYTSWGPTIFCHVHCCVFSR